MNVYIPGTGLATKGPCPDGFHVPLKSEIQGLITIMNGLNITTRDGWKTNLHLPLAGRRNCSTTNIDGQDSAGLYWSSSPYGDSYPRHSTYLSFNSGGVSYSLTYRGDSLPIRGFKDSFVVPASGWTVIQGTIGSAGIFWNQTDGIISITSDGTTGYTIQDKNLGATTVYSNGDTLSAANMGYMYQWGNNYGFSSTGTISNTSSTQVDASNYGPGNYYSSSTFITTGTGERSSVQNNNLRGGVDGNVQVVNELKNAYIGNGWWRLSTDFTQYTSLAQIQAQGWIGTTTVSSTAPSYSYGSNGIEVYAGGANRGGGIYTKLPSKITAQNKIIMKYTGYIPSIGCGIYMTLSTNTIPDLKANTQFDVSFAQRYNNSVTDQGIGIHKRVNGTYTWNVWYDSKDDLPGSTGNYIAEVILDLPNRKSKWITTSPSSMAYTSETIISSDGIECLIGMEYFIIWGYDYNSGNTTYIKSAEIAVI